MPVYIPEGIFHPSGNKAEFLIAVWGAIGLCVRDGARIAVYPDYARERFPEERREYADATVEIEKGPLATAGLNPSPQFFYEQRRDGPVHLKKRRRRNRETRTAQNLYNVGRISPAGGHHDVAVGACVQNDFTGAVFGHTRYFTGRQDLIDGLLGEETA